MNAWVLLLGIPLALLLCLLPLKGRKKYKDGKKVANAVMVEELPEYKALKIKYRLFYVLGTVAILAAMILMVIMMARPVEITTIEPELRNRDIFLCMDISDSMDELNYDICDNLKKVVKELDGERFGITIFNGQTVLLVPLTNDYDYVLETIDHLQQVLWTSLNGMETNGEFNLQDYYYKYSGTLSQTSGSSFIGEGLATTLYSFPELEEDNGRSRSIIFTTDNQLNGTPLITIKEAAELCTQYDVKVFAIAPDHIEDENNFRNYMLGTGGKYYKNTAPGAYKQLIKDIEATDTSETAILDVQTLVMDKPQALFVFLLLCLGGYMIICRRMRV